MFKSTPVNGTVTFIGNWELFQPRSRRYFYILSLFASLFAFLFQRSHSFFQSILSSLLVSSSMGHDIFHRLNTNHVWNSCDTGKRLLLDVKECRMFSSPSYCYHRQSLSVHGYFYNNLSFFFFVTLFPSFPLSLSLSLFLLLRISFIRRNAHSFALPIIGIMHWIAKKLAINQAIFKIIRLYMLYRWYIFIGPLYRFLAIEAQKLGRERKGENSKRGGEKRKSDEEMEKDREEKRAMKKKRRRGGGTGGCEEKTRRESAEKG